MIPAPENSDFPGTFPVFSCAESASFERTFFANPANDENVFMRRAATGIANETAALFSEIRARKIRSVFVFAGKGKNGTDALLAAEILHSRHPCEIKILLAQSPEKMAPSAADAFNRLLKTGAVFHVWRDEISADVFLNGTADIAFDGLLGYNFHAPLKNNFLEIIRWANKKNDTFKVRVAVDLPSGIGDENGTDAFQSDLTIACGIVKQPLLKPENIGICGRIRLVCIGFPNDTAGDFRAAGRGLVRVSPLRKLRQAQCDKRSFGHLFILGGSRKMPGALLMNVHAALRAGAGLVTAFCPESMHANLAAAAPEAMWVPMPETPDGTLALEGEFLLREKISNATALLCGSGMSDHRETLALLKSVVSHTKMTPLILDADALRNEVLSGLAGRMAPLVLLPHAGEFARISKKKLRETAADFSAHIALKGAPTRVSNGKKEIAICAGGPVFARGGSGDILAGITGAIFARKLFENPLQNLATAVAWHGCAGDSAARKHGAETMTPLKILDFLGEVLRD